MCCHFLLLGNLLDPGIEPVSPALQADSLPSEPSGKPRRDKLIKRIKNFKSLFEQKWIQIGQHLIQQTARSSKELYKRRLYFFFLCFLFLKFLSYLTIIHRDGSSLLCTRFSQVAAVRGYSLVAVWGLLIAVASLVAEDRSSAVWASGVVAPRF